MRNSRSFVLEEVLLDDVVERYRESVQTQQLKKIADIEKQDCEIFEASMTKCSKWLSGYDQAAAENEAVPDPAALKSDIEALENWVKEIRRRREN